MRPPPQDTSSQRIWRDWVEVSSFHGVIDIHKPGYGKVWKASWLFVIIAFVAIAIYSIKEIILEYVTNPTIQNYRMEPKVSFDLPDFVLCTHQRLNIAELEAMGASRTLAQSLVSMFETQADITRLLAGPATYYKDVSDTTRADYATFRQSNGNISWEQIMRRASIQCESLVKACSWGDQTHCCSLAIPYLDRVYGQCYRFRNTKNKMSHNGDAQYFPGVGSGIEMIIQTPSFGHGWSKSSALRGVLFEVVHPDELLSFTFSQLPAGVSATIHLSMQVAAPFWGYLGPHITDRCPLSDHPAYQHVRSTRDLRRVHRGYEVGIRPRWPVFLRYLKQELERLLLRHVVQGDDEGLQLYSDAQHHQPHPLPPIRQVSRRVYGRHLRRYEASSSRRLPTSVQAPFLHSVHQLRQLRLFHVQRGRPDQWSRVPGVEPYFGPQ